VTVTLYHGADGFGHIGIGVNSQQTYGCRPVHAPYPNPIGMPPIDSYDFAWTVVPGEMTPDDPRETVDSVVIPTTPAQDQAVQNYINLTRADAGVYSLFGRNCATCVEDALDAAGIPTPLTIFPKVLFKYLKNPYPLPPPPIPFS
jgi:hypothetical protein